MDCFSVIANLEHIVFAIVPKVVIQAFVLGILGAVEPDDGFREKLHLERANH